MLAADLCVLSCMGTPICFLAVFRNKSTVCGANTGLQLLLGKSELKKGHNYVQKF